MQADAAASFLSIWSATPILGDVQLIDASIHSDNAVCCYFSMLLIRVATDRCKRRRYPTKYFRPSQAVPPVESSLEDAESQSASVKSSSNNMLYLEVLLASHSTTINPSILDGTEQTPMESRQMRPKVTAE
jgi:hypothetical protein